MIEVRPFDTLGGANHGWLDAHHHFSFAEYYDPKRMSWGRLRVWNDDLIAPKSGFPPHPHRDMEIITYVRTGAITHKDSMGNKGRTAAGDVQVMSAGTGVRHAEFNLEDETPRSSRSGSSPMQRAALPAGARNSSRSRIAPAHGRSLLQARAMTARSKSGPTPALRARPSKPARNSCGKPSPTATSMRCRPRA
jgi:redox-sensitive bicupin YhaK (pirin superfamily)